MGLLVPGYVMIISRNHINSMAYVLEEEMTELINLVEHLSDLISDKFKFRPILFEHGSAIGCMNKGVRCSAHD